MANGLNMRGNTTARRTQPSLSVSQALAPCARQPGFRARWQALLFAPKPTLHESRHALGETCTSPSLLRMTHQPESVRQAGQSTALIESPKVKNPNPMLHLIQHHLALLHASSRGNDRIGSSDLLDSGGWVARSLQVYHQWCTGGQRGAHPWDKNDGPRGHFHKSCNQQPTNLSTQMSKPTPRLNQTHHQRAFHTVFDNQYGHKKTNTKYWNTN